VTTPPGRCGGVPANLRPAARLVDGSLVGYACLFHVGSDAAGSAPGRAGRLVPALVEASDPVVSEHLNNVLSLPVGVVLTVATSNWLRQRK
jgi:hypothetical protein